MHSILDAEAATVQTMHLKENRSALRQMARRATLLGTYRTGQSFQATLEDISRRGLRVRSETNMPCGEPITIAAPDGTALDPIECRIMRVQLVGSEDRDMFEYGLQIVQTSRDQGHRWFLYFCYGGVAKLPVPLI